MFNVVNIVGILNVFKVVEELGINKVVFVVFFFIYGDSWVLLKWEGVIGKFILFYVVIKLVCELYVDVFFNFYDFNYIGLRYFNVFGFK